jgi:hypothetical protein
MKSRKVYMTQGEMDKITGIPGARLDYWRDEETRELFPVILIAGDHDRDDGFHPIAPWRPNDYTRARQSAARPVGCQPTDTGSSPVERSNV